MHVLHVNWSGERLWVWGESDTGATGAGGPAPESADGAPHPFAISHEALRSVIDPGPARLEVENGELTLNLPAHGGRPAPSPTVAHALGASAHEEHEDGGAVAVAERPRIEGFRVPALGVKAAAAGALLDHLVELYARDDREPGPAEGEVLGSSVKFMGAALRLARSLLAQQRFIPGLRQDTSGELEGQWQPWLADTRTAERVAVLLASMPASVRAVRDAHEHQPWPILESFLSAVVDAACRATLARETMHDALGGRDASADAHVAWLTGLLAGEVRVPAAGSARTEMVKTVRRWISGLEDRGISSKWRLLLRLEEPPEAALLGDMDEPDESITWPLTFSVQSQENPAIVIGAEDIWILPTDSVTLEGRRLDGPQELLLKELGRAARLYPHLEKALGDSEPSSLELTTRQAYAFLREHRPILTEQGFGVWVPEWWDQPSARVGARLKISSDPLEAILGQGVGVTPTRTRLGMGALVSYSWDISIGGTTLSLSEFEKLANRRTPLVRINGRWVEIRPEDVKAAVRFIQENPGGEMPVQEAIRLAYGTDSRVTGVPIVGLETTGWVGVFFGEGADNQQIPIISPPARFHGQLRPYQIRGVSWLAFLERFGFGPCLADDMGLGKTIQLLALLAFEREVNGEHAWVMPEQVSRGAGEQVTPSPAPDASSSPAHLPTSSRAQPAASPEAAADQAAQAAEAGRTPPTLLVVPMSVVGNWLHEAKRFCPELKFIVHHGVERAQGDAFVAQAESADAIVTTYALAHRDRETLSRVQWQRVVLDEAQYIKNPLTKQSTAVRSIPAGTRVALTGTPVENRLSELWSILDFLNPEYLGSASGFRKRFAVPIERYHDGGRARQLRDLVKPFILRRLKTDPAVAADLPEKVESREFSHLTTEQAELYESVVKRMLAEVEAAEGIQRRGLVLSTLVKLKQICNHPSQYLKDHAPDSAAAALTPDPSRSGKCVRTLEMLDECLQAGEQALVFTQFREMGTLLASMLRHHLNREVQFLHGGTPQATRVEMVERFQRADGSVPIFIVSLKAGGVGLNLTAATHVFHFDRWWNPAVENQATDRAHRIGQYRTVQVHKFVVRGTLEERIDEMIEQKTELAEHIIGSGESWLTELSTDQLREMLTLRREAVGDEGE